MTTLEDVKGVAEVMNDFPKPWFICGGWAIQLFNPDLPREHESVEIGVFRSDQAELREQLVGWWLEKIGKTETGAGWVEWQQDEELALPTHQARAINPLSTAPDQFAIFLSEGTPAQWQSRRHPGLSRPISEVVMRSIDGIPYLAPEIQLLYKAKYHRPKDEHDFKAAMALMSPEQKASLAQMLEKFHPGDPWLRPIGEGY